MPRLNEKLASLHLSVDPFSADPPLENLFPGAMRRASLDQLLQLSRESANILALVGPDGSGKTTIGDFFSRHAAEDQIVARARASLLTSPAQLLQEMFKAFVLDFPPQSSLADLRAALQSYFSAVHKQSRSVVLVVDDAQELGDDALGLLARLALTDNTDGAFHVVLLGEPQLLEMLEYTCPMKNGQSQFTSIHLPAMNLDETRNYLRFRLNCAGFNRNGQPRPLPFSARQLEKIHKQSGGHPGAINVLAGQLLSGSVTASRPVWLDSLLRIRLPRSYALVAVVLLAVLFLAFLAGRDDRGESQSAQRTISLTVPLANRELVSGAGSSVAADANPVSVDPLSPALQGSDVVSADQVVADVSVSAVPAPAAQSVAEVMAIPDAPAQDLAPTATAVAVDRALPAAIAADPAPAPSSADPLASQRARILALPSASFTLQLLGSSSRPNVEEYVRNNSASPLYWFETRNQGRPWFVVIHGSYATRAEAQSALGGLSSALQGAQPWIRALGTVQDEIRALN